MAGLVPAAADEVSAANAAQFAAYAHVYEQIVAQGARVHEQIVHTLHSNAGSYENAEADNTASALTGSGLAGIGQSATGGSGGPLIPPLSLSSLATPYRTATAIASAGLAGLTAHSVSPASTLSAGLGVKEAAAGPAAVVAADSGASGAPVSAGLGRSASVGSLSVPQGWAAGPAPSATLAGTTLPGSQATPSLQVGSPTAPMVPALPLAGRRADRDNRGSRRPARHGRGPTEDLRSENVS
jgi:hypothetical protein